ncbi:MAG: VIT1/CCC1 transporter family protein [Haloarculaceae archaeon]
MVVSRIHEWVGRHFDPISRRYFVSNGFDGALTSVGVAFGSYLSGVPEGAIVVKVGVGAAVGLATSGVWSVWEIERAEKRIELAEVEAAMLADLTETRVEDRQRERRRLNAVMSGVGPLLGILVPIAPYLFATDVFSMLQATLLAIALGVGLLFAFGAYMGSISEQSPLVAGARMGLAGLVVAAINVLLPG